jgi:hypothetical protein
MRYKLNNKLNLADEPGHQRVTIHLFSFETELINKIQFKASSKVSHDAFLFKAFKFFDLYNNGCLSKTDFFKAIAKCGVIVDTHVTIFSLRIWTPSSITIVMNKRN